VSSLAVLRPGEPLAAVPSIGRAVGVEPRVAAREADVTHALFERHARQIYNYCLHQLSSREEAEDAVQTTFMNAFRGLKRGIVPEVEQAWLFKIAENVCLSRRRSSWRRGRVESPNDFEVLQEIVPSRGSRADELIGLEDALEAMPENQRRAILLREWQGLSYREIADELAISQAAVETLIFRARRTLAQGLEESPSTKRRVLSRSANGLSGGSLLAALKSALTGGAAVKAVALAVAAATATVAATHVEKRVHARHAPTAVVDSRANAAHSARTRKVVGTKTSSAGTRVGHATRSTRPDRLRKRAVTAPIVVAHAKSALPPTDAPAAPAPPPPAAPTDQPAATPPAAAPQAPADEPKVGHATSGDPGKANGNAYGHEKKAADQGAPSAPADKSNGNGNGKKKDAATPPQPAAPPASATPPDAPATAPSATAPPAAPDEAAPAQAEDHGNGHADDNAHTGGRDKGK
jgi:RNA polymerase sigma-70 factor, ECF subfamily